MFRGKRPGLRVELSQARHAGEDQCMGVGRQLSHSRVEGRMTRFQVPLLLLASMLPSAEAGTAQTCAYCQSIYEEGTGWWHFYEVHGQPPPYANFDAATQHADTTSGACDAWHTPCSAPLAAFQREVTLARFGVPPTRLRPLHALNPGMLTYDEMRGVLAVRDCRTSQVIASSFVGRSRAAVELRGFDSFVLAPRFDPVLDRT